MGPRILILNKSRPHPAPDAAAKLWVAELCGTNYRASDQASGEDV